MLEEDPTLRVHREASTGETIIVGAWASRTSRSSSSGWQRKFAVATSTWACRRSPTARRSPVSAAAAGPPRAPVWRPRAVRRRLPRNRADRRAAGSSSSSTRSSAAWCPGNSSRRSRRAFARRWSRACWRASRWSTCGCALVFGKYHPVDSWRRRSRRLARLASRRRWREAKPGAARTGHACRGHGAQTSSPAT